MKRIIFVILTFFIFSLSVQALDLTPNAVSSILIDNATGKVLYEKNADEVRPPASMTKIASMLVVMDAIDSGKLSLDDKVVISEAAASMGGSQIFVEAGEVYTVHDLLKGVAIASGNDAVVALAEKVAGSEEAFVNLMNEKAREVGAKSTNFVNAHGLDTEGHTSTARDMALLARELLKHEKILEYTSIYEEYLTRNDGSKSWLVNTNRLVRFYDGVDGLKTGYTTNAGYCLTATAKKDNLRLISVVMGEDTSENRSSDTVKALNYGFNTFKLNIIKEKGASVGKVRVLKGKKDSVEVVLKNDATELLKSTDEVPTYKFNIKIDKIIAPVSVGDIVGTAEVIDNDGNVIDEVSLTINENLEKANIIDYFLKNIKTIMGGKTLIKQN